MSEKWNTPKIMNTIGDQNGKSRHAALRLFQGTTTQTEKQKQQRQQTARGSELATATENDASAMENGASGHFCRDGSAQKPGATSNERLSRRKYHVAIVGGTVRVHGFRRMERMGKDTGNGTDVDDEGEEIRTTKKKLENVWQFTRKECLDKANENGGGEDEDEDGSTRNQVVMEEHFYKAHKVTFALVNRMLDSIIQDGLHAYHQAEQKAVELQVAQETIRVKDQELECLRQTDANHVLAIQDLLRAANKGKTDVLNNSQFALVEAKLRNQIAVFTVQRGEALIEIKESQRKVQVLEQELQETKTKLVNVEGEKRDLERRAKSLDNNITSDCEFFKRRVRHARNNRSCTMNCSVLCRTVSLDTGSFSIDVFLCRITQLAEQNTHMQGLNAVIAEKNNKIEEMRRRVERALTNNRMATFRASRSTGH